MVQSPFQEGAVLLGKYRVERVLGQGGMGIVVAAWHLRLEQRVAIKILRPELIQNHEVVARFLREARACGALKHPNIVEMIDVAETDDGDPFMVMELLTGETVDAPLKRQRRLDQAQAARIARDVAQALTAAPRTIAEKRGNTRRIKGLRLVLSDNAERVARGRRAVG